MILRKVIYGGQFFSFLAIVSIIFFQYELLMLDRNVALTYSLIIFSLGQILNVLTMLFVRRLDTLVKNRNRIVQISLCVRTIAVGCMFFTQNSIVFIVLFLIYQMSSSANVLFEGMVAQWSFEKVISFSRLRIWGSFGFATSGFIATLIFDLTGSINNILLLVFIVNIFNTIIAFKVPVNVEKSTNNGGSQVRIPIKIRYILFFGGFVTALPNSFAIVLNNHYRTIFQLSIEQAIFFSSIAVFLGSFIAELTAFLSIDKLLNKFNPTNIILLGIFLSFLRWMIAFIAPNHITFTSSYILHGFSFVFVYLGGLAYIKKHIGNEFTSRIVLEFVIISNALGLILIQVSNLILNFFNSVLLLGINMVISFILVLVFFRYIYLNDKKLNARNSSSPR